MAACSTTRQTNTSATWPGPNLLFNGWSVTPTGEEVRISDMPLKMVVAPDGKTLVAVSGGYNNTGVSLLDIATRKLTQFVPLRSAWNGLAFSADGQTLFVAGGPSGIIHAFIFADGKITAKTSAAPDREAKNTMLAGLAVHPQSGKLYVSNEGAHEVWIVDPATLSLEMKIPVGAHPHTCVFGADKRHLYVSSWGGRSVTVVDTQSNRRVHDIAVGVRPNDMALGLDGRLFVACSGDNTVRVIQTRALEKPSPGATPEHPPLEYEREIIGTSLYPASPEGSTPDAVAVSADGKTLFVANADNNNVMVADIANPAIARVEGFIPVGWYPTALAVSADGRTLFVGNGKGLYSSRNFPALGADPKKLAPPSQYNHPGTLLEGHVSFIAQPGPAELARFTEQARRNSPYLPEQLQRARAPNRSVIPDKVGQPGPIKYVLYIIKENRTYDQVFGDFRDAKGLRAGNGDPHLVMYGANVAPNHHQLARDYVLLDNLYCNGEVSVDGHSWCDAAIATDYNQRQWIMSYSGHGRLPGNDEMETPAAGYLWDLCKRHGVSFKCYGEGSWRVPETNRGTWKGGRDLVLVDGWIHDLHAAEAGGELPRFMIMSLGEDHTHGTSPGKPTPEACVASNDIGLGKIVAAASRSKFWKEMAIFVIEDDAQNGPDHVDAHRTVGLVISPYCQRGIVDSTLYTTASMVRTMELILGLPPLTQYDAGATPMFNSFQKRAKLVAYDPSAPKVDVMAINQPNAPGAKQSMLMNFDEYDRAPEDELNRILWEAAKGPDVPYPAPIHRAVFTRP